MEGEVIGTSLANEVRSDKMADPVNKREWPIVHIRSFGPRYPPGRDVAANC